MLGTRIDPLLVSLFAFAVFITVATISIIYFKKRLPHTKTSTSLLVSGFISIIIMIVIFALGAISLSKELSEHTAKFYKHPFTVSNAALRIEVEISEIRRHMLNFALSNNDVERKHFISEIDKHEAETQEYFDIILENFLGDKRTIEGARKTFSEWDSVRSNIFELSMKNPAQAVYSINQGEGSIHYWKVESQVEEMIAFANIKASEFLLNSQADQQKGTSVLSSGAVIIIILSLLIAYFVIYRVRQSEEALALAVNSAKNANRAKSDLLANMSHELRTPLNAIIGFSSTMREETFGPVGSDKNREYLNDINFSGQHLLELINDILDVSAIERGALELNESNVDLFKLAEVTVRIIQPRADHGKVKATSLLEPGAPMIYADERRVKQVLFNLISNAVKFTPEGGKIIVDSLLNDDGSLSIYVSDTGYGMNDDETAIALIKFGQVDSGLDRKHEGTGLGLPLTKGLMELHGGVLEIDSLEGYGTMVTATFPKERVIQNVS